MATGPSALSFIACPWGLEEHSINSRNLKKKALGIVVPGYMDVIDQRSLQSEMDGALSVVSTIDFDKEKMESS